MNNERLTRDLSKCIIIIKVLRIIPKNFSFYTRMVLQNQGDFYILFVLRGFEEPLVVSRSFYGKKIIFRTNIKWSITLSSILKDIDDIFI